jgi:hypothetical protein
LVLAEDAIGNSSRHYVLSRRRVGRGVEHLLLHSTRSAFAGLRREPACAKHWLVPSGRGAWCVSTNTRLLAGGLEVLMLCWVASKALPAAVLLAGGQEACRGCGTSCRGLLHGARSCWGRRALGRRRLLRLRLRPPPAWDPAPAGGRREPARGRRQRASAAAHWSLLRRRLRASAAASAAGAALRALPEFARVRTPQARTRARGGRKGEGEREKGKERQRGITRTTEDASGAHELLGRGRARATRLVRAGRVRQRECGRRGRLAVRLQPRLGPSA